MTDQRFSSSTPPSLTGAGAVAPPERGGGRLPVRRAIEHAIAVSYGTLYDAVVHRFPPYEALLGELEALVARSAPAAASPRGVRVLDVSCGIGNVSLRLATRGYTVVGVDPVRHLVAIAREKNHPVLPNLSFQHLDVARAAPAGAGTFDVLVSMHTLYWHPDPPAFLAACRQALRPGGHAIFLTYGRPARVGPVFGEVRAVEGLGAAVHALRWLVPTVAFEALRDCRHRYLSRADFHAALETAGFQILESRATFLAGLSHLAWTRLPGDGPDPASDETAGRP